MIVDEMSFSYKSNEPIFNGLSLHFDKNKIYSILGPSGCGKTTLFKLLVGIEQPQDGKIEFNDEDGCSIMMQADTLLPLLRIISDWGMSWHVIRSLFQSL